MIITDGVLDNPEDTIREVSVCCGFRVSIIIVGVGNSVGFVEPLEATALQVIAVESSTLADTLPENTQKQIMA